MEQTVWDEILTQAMDSASANQRHSDIAREHDVILPIKGKCVCALEALHSGIWLLTLGLCLGK